MVFENGVCFTDKILDYEMFHFRYYYLKEMLTGIKREDFNVKAYGVLSLLDFDQKI